MPALLNFSSVRYTNHWKIQLNKTCNCIFIYLVVHRITAEQLFCRLNFFCTVFLQEECKPPAESCMASYTKNPNHYDWLTINSYRAKFGFSELISSLPVWFSAHPKCTLTPMFNKITEPSLHCFNATVVSPVPD